MNKNVVIPTEIEAPPTNLAPHWNWNRAIPQPGHMGVDFEGRVDFRRLHQYRLGRARQALADFRARGAAHLRRQQHPVPHLDEDRGVGTRQALPLRAARRRPASGALGLRLGGGAPPSLLRLAAAGEFPGRHARHARHRAALGRADEAARRGDQGSAGAGRRRRHADRRRSHRAGHVARTREGRPQAGRRPAGHARRPRDQEHRRDRAPQPGGRDGRRRLSADLRGPQARRPRERPRRPGQQAPLRARLG